MNLLHMCQADNSEHNNHSQPSTVHFSVVKASLAIMISWYSSWGRPAAFKYLTTPYIIRVMRYSVVLTAVDTPVRVIG